MPRSRSSGTRTTRFTRSASTLTNAFITVSCGRSCIRGSATDEPNAVHRSSATQRPQYFTMVTSPFDAGGQGALLLGHPHCASSRRLLLRFGLLLRTGALEVLSVHGHEFLNAATRDRFANIDIPVRVDVDHVAEGKMARTMTGTGRDAADAERPDHHSAGLVDHPGIVVAEIDVEDRILPGGTHVCEIIDIGPEVHVAAARAG